MKLIIEIFEKDYNDIMTDSPRNLNHYERLIVNGIPIPKGHGRLIDVDAIVYEKECVYLSDGGCTTESTPNISATPAIIEADKEQKDGNID